MPPRVASGSATAALGLLVATAFAGCTGGAAPKPSDEPAPSSTPAAAPVSDKTFDAAMEAFGYARLDDGWTRGSYDAAVMGGSGVVWAGAGHGSIRADQHGPTLAAGDYYLEVQCYGVEFPGRGASILWDVTVGDAPAVDETSSVSCPEGEVTTSLAPIELAKPRDGLRIEIAPLDGVTAVVDYALYQGEMPPQE
ncbi:hypothetical protein [Zhihengliuella halotolerans]|uniref:Uncharacterized protein n=1 Tax=Zhihengliuella halotolerans TaxID=370736 RepID=A0A4V2GAA8_9MICC|nr:hypothetical protein [Zhihengliuella halotolerans]RZU63516.1 hypothetical protein EV380_3137 [Zhihengliuella halotolerans]